MFKPKLTWVPSHQVPYIKLQSSSVYFSWEYLSHDQARSRTYRWGEDGLLGFTDSQCHLCFGLALWNEKDPILKERFFGLTPHEGEYGPWGGEGAYHFVWFSRLASCADIVWHFCENEGNWKHYTMSAHEARFRSASPRLSTLLLLKCIMLLIVLAVNLDVNKSHILPERDVWR